MDIGAVEVVSQLPGLHTGRHAAYAYSPADPLRHAHRHPQPGQALPPHLLAPSLAVLFSTLVTSGTLRQACSCFMLQGQVEAVLKYSLLM